MKLLLPFIFFVTLFAQTATRTVLLSWTASTSSGVTGYNVYRATSGSGPFTLLTTTPVTTTSYNDETATVGQTLTYQVTAVVPACTSSTPVGTPCGESDPATAATNVPPKPATPVTVTIIVK